MGRTLTHEVGHFFEIWHTWGDDGGLCPWNGGADDGIEDTPPEGDAKYYNYPDTIPGGTYYDECRYDGTSDTQLTLYGVSSLDYMNYTDDAAMHLFTTDQAAVMAAQVSPGGESYSLTLNPALLEWPGSTNVAPDANSVDIFPNPTSGILTIRYEDTANPVRDIFVFNILGQRVQKINVPDAQSDYYSVDLTGLPKGIYFVRCNFASGSTTRKILLE